VAKKGTRERGNCVRKIFSGSGDKRQREDVDWGGDNGVTQPTRKGGDKGGRKKEGSRWEKKMPLKLTYLAAILETLE